MEHVTTKSYRILSIFLVSFLILAGGLYSTVAKANNSSQLAGQQLAYYIGYHSSPGYVYHGPGYVYYGPRYHHHYYHPRKLYWTGWRYIGHGCRKHCLVDRWSGRIIRCERVCRR